MQYASNFVEDILFECSSAFFYYSGQQQLQDMYVQKYFYFGYYVTQQLHSYCLCLSIPDLQCIVTIVTS